MKKAYKIVRMELNGGVECLNWLFHGNFGTRKIKQYRWQVAEIRENAIDGAGSSYRSGFHVLYSLEDLKAYAKRFKNRKGLVIVECEVDKVWKKEKSGKKNVMLAEEIMVGRIVYDLFKMEVV